jgi:AraC-like DNA-binding protein
MAGDSKMKAVLQWIEENYAEPASLEELAAVAGMNPHYFCEFFKRYTRRSPIDYLNLYRIDSACRMLKVSGCSVTEAAFSCGFNDLSYFVKTFKKYKGVTPRQYRRRFEIEGLW